MATDTNFNKFTYEDYVLFPDDGKRHEIIEGDHYMNPAPNSYHQSIVGRLFAQLMMAIESKKLGYVFVSPIDVQLDEFNIVQPDLVVVLNDRKSILTKQNIQGVPSMLIEIVSPGNPQHDRKLKKKLYERAAVPEYWIVDPDAMTVEQFWLEDQRYVVQENSGNNIPLKVFPNASLITTGLWDFDF